MKFAIEGREYEFQAKMTLEEAFLLKEKAYLTVTELGPAIERADPQAIAAVMYLLKRRNGEAVKWDDILKLDIYSFRVVLSEDELESATGDSPTEVKPVDPTSPKRGKTRKSAT